MRGKGRLIIKNYAQETSGLARFNGEVVNFDIARAPHSCTPGDFNEILGDESGGYLDDLQQNILCQ